jgi:hypothetical protein
MSLKSTEKRRRKGVGTVEKRGFKGLKKQRKRL